jgi:hypothetical protein
MLLAGSACALAVALNGAQVVYAMSVANTISVHGIFWHNTGR